MPAIDPDSDNLRAALLYAQAGWYVLPVRRNAKHPGSLVGRGWPAKSSRDPKVITSWLAGTDHGIALHCGRSGAVVFDVDHPEKLPDVLRSAIEHAPYQSTRPGTPGRGHYIFAMPPGRIIGNGTGRLAGDWGEIRGANGVIIAANSHHSDGGEYRWQRTGSLSVLPYEIAALLDDATSAEDAATNEQVAAFLAEHTAAQRPEILAGWKSALRNHFAESSRHNGAVSVLTGVLKEARAGYFPAAAAVDVLRPMFIAAATREPTGAERRRTDREAEDEWAGIMAWAVAQANAADMDEVHARTEAKMPEDAPDVEGVAHSGHLGMAVKLGRQFRHKLIYVNQVGWHRWDGRRWAPDGDGAARRAVHAVIKRDRAIVKRLELPAEEETKALKAIARYETAAAISGILTEAAALQVFSVVVGDLDADPYLLNCANGTLDLRTMQLRDHDPADRITKVARAAYRSETDAGPEWTRFLAKVLPDKEVRDYTQRTASLGLLGEVNGDKQIAPIMTGAGANGKSTFLEAVMFTLGDYATTAAPDLLMLRNGEVHPTGVADLLGTRFASVAETEKDRRFDLALLKRLTGSDTLKARFMRQDFFHFEPSHLLVMATNHLPRIDDDTEAVWRRIRVIPFTVQIPADERDKALRDKLRVEADAVLTWLVDGWREYRRRGGLDEPNAVLVATGAYQADSDAVGRFITEECLTGGAQSSATTQALYKRWEVWATTEGCPQLSRIAFGRALDAKGYPTDQKAHGRPRRGICLKSEKVQLDQ